MHASQYLGLSACLPAYLPAYHSSVDYHSQDNHPFLNCHHPQNENISMRLHYALCHTSLEMVNTALHNLENHKVLLKDLVGPNEEPRLVMGPVGGSPLI